MFFELTLGKFEQKFWLQNAFYFKKKKKKQNRKPKTFNFVLGLSRLTNNVERQSGEQPRKSALHIHVSILPQTPLPPRLPHNIEQHFMCYAVKFLLAIHLKYSREDIYALYL